jgi:hypothetical protein
MNNSMVCKHPWEYSLWWHKNKNTIHAYFLSAFYKYENKKILNRHPARILPIRKSV